MASSNYSACLQEVFKYEGGFVNHPSDPGGATNHGITIAVARKFWKADASVQDMREMPKSVAADIYRKQYWNKVSGDALPEGIDLCTFDAAVNSGTGRADKWLAYGLNASLRPYPELAKIAQNVSDKAAVVRRYCDKRLSFLQSLRTWETFGKGWQRRVASVKALGLRMALAAAGKPKDEIIKDLGKEVTKHDGSLQKDVTKGSAGGGTTGGAVWAVDGGTILLIAVSVLAVLFIAHRVYTHMVAKEALNEQIQDIKRELLAEGSVLRDDEQRQDVSPVQPKE
jgi:lysozyme family protein